MQKKAVGRSLKKNKHTNKPEVLRKTAALNKTLMKKRLFMLHQYNVYN